MSGHRLDQIQDAEERTAAARAMAAKRPVITKPCARCGKAASGIGRIKYCSAECRVAASNGRRAERLLKAARGEWGRSKAGRIVLGAPISVTPEELSTGSARPKIHELRRTLLHALELLDDLEHLSREPTSVRID